MIIGIGSDLIDIRRIEKTLDRFGDRFTQRVFTEIERKKSDGRRLRAASYAKRFAAKEACSKALGTGIRRGVHWRTMGVINLPSGKPTMKNLVPELMFTSTSTMVASIPKTAQPCPFTTLINTCRRGG